MTDHSAEFDLGVEAIDGGWRIRETDDFYVDVLRMAFNNRIVTTAKSHQQVWSRGWCYIAAVPLLEVFARCYTFEPDDPFSEPEGWIKDVIEQRYACGWMFPPGEHQGYTSDCSRCGSRRSS